MEYRALGRTGLDVSVVGLGLAAIGRPGYITMGHADDLAGRTEPPDLERHVHAMLDAAADAGVTYVDAARSYGRAEEFLGRWLGTARSPTEPVVGSKWGYVYTADWDADADEHEVKIHTRENLDRQYDESRTHLGDHLDLYQIHSATLASGVLDDDGVLERLGELRDGGLLIGLSVSGPRQGEAIRRAIDVEVGDAPLFATVQATWNVLEPSAEPSLRSAAAAGMGVIVKEAVANGRLTRRNPRIRDLVEDRRPGTNPDAAAIAAALHRPWASVVLSGAATVDHLASNLGALAIGHDELPDLSDLAEDPDTYWTTRSALPWN